jgi:hypothetical protein
MVCDMPDAHAMRFWEKNRTEFDTFFPHIIILLIHKQTVAGFDDPLNYVNWLLV